jgi:Icc-related predicted phosphoesterase
MVKQVLKYLNKFKLNISDIIRDLTKKKILAENNNNKFYKKENYILSRDSEVTLSHWSRSIELAIMPFIDL